MAPYPAIGNQTDGARADFEMIGDMGEGSAISSQLPDFQDLLVGQFMTAMRRAFLLVRPENAAPVKRIFAFRDVLQIAQSAIGAPAIFVIGFMAERASSDERSEYQHMHWMLARRIVTPQLDTLIALVKKRAHDFFIVPDAAAIRYLIASFVTRNRLPRFHFNWES